MHDVLSIAYLLLESVFTGFGIVIPILLVFRSSGREAEVRQTFLHVAVKLAIACGILFFAAWAVQSFYPAENALVGRAFGPYWWAWWYYPCLMLVLTQLLWIKKLSSSKVGLVIIALMLFLLPSPKSMELFTIMLSETHRDYQPAGEEGLWFSVFIGLASRVIIKALVFTFLTFAIMLVSGALRKKP